MHTSWQRASTLPSFGRFEASAAALDDAIKRTANADDGLVRGITIALKGGMLLYSTGDVQGGMNMVEQARRIHERDNDYEVAAHRSASSHR